MIYWGRPDVENINHINSLAKSKKDGVFKVRGIGYRVRNGKVTHYHCISNGKHEVRQNAGHFVVPIGEFDKSEAAHAALKKIQ